MKLPNKANKLVINPGRVYLITKQYHAETTYDTLIMLTVGKEIPIKYPNATPMTVVIMSLKLSLGFLRNPLQTLYMTLHHMEQPAENRNITNRLYTCGQQFQVLPCRSSVKSRNDENTCKQKLPHTVQKDNNCQLFTKECDFHHKLKCKMVGLGTNDMQKI